MPEREVLVDTNILIYHTNGLQHAADFLADLLDHDSFAISILTKIEFLGWHRQNVPETVVEQRGFC